MTNGFGLNGEMSEFRGHSNLVGSSLGLVVDGSLTNGVEVRLASETLIEDLKVGTFVTIQGSLGRFFGTLTEIALGSSDPRLKQNPPTVDDPFIAQVMAGSVAYGTITVPVSYTHLTLPTNREV